MLLFEWSNFKFMHKGTSEYSTVDKRSELRRTKLRNYRVEIKFIGEPIYQFRVIDLSTNGARLLIKDNSCFLKLIKVDQIVDVNFISPQHTNPAGMCKAKIKHITNMNKGRYKGHHLVGIIILENQGENVR